MRVAAAYITYQAFPGAPILNQGAIPPWAWRLPGFPRCPPTRQIALLCLLYLSVDTINYITCHPFPGTQYPVGTSHRPGGWEKLISHLPGFPHNPPKHLPIYPPPPPTHPSSLNSTGVTIKTLRSVPTCKWTMNVRQYRFKATYSFETDYRQCLITVALESRAWMTTLVSNFHTKGHNSNNLRN